MSQYIIQFAWYPKKLSNKNWVFFRRYYIFYTGYGVKSDVNGASIYPTVEILSEEDALIYLLKSG